MKVAQWFLVPMVGICAGLTIWLAFFGVLPEDLGKILVGAAISLAGILLITKLEDSE